MPDGAIADTPEAIRRLKASPPETTVPLNVHARSVALTILAVSASIVVLQWAQEVFVPIVLSILISYALEPIVLALMRLHLPRLAASLLVMAAVTCGGAYLTYAVSGQVAAIVAELPSAAAKARQTLVRGRNQGGTIQQVRRAAEELQRTADEAAGRNPAPAGVQRVQIEEPTFNVRQYLSWGSASLLAFASQLVLIVFFVFFLLASGDLFKRKFVRIAGPSLEQKKITVQILNEIDSQIAKFLLVRVVTSVVVGTATWLAFLWIGLEQAAVWGIAAGVFNSIPYFGPVIVAAGTFVVAFIQFGTLTMAGYAAALSIAITSLEGWVLTPWMTSRTARTNEVAVFVGLIFWSFVWGLWGTLLAVPMLVVLKAFCDRIDDLKPVGELLGE